jgi:hypothetical protein
MSDLMSLNCIPVPLGSVSGWFCNQKVISDATVSYIWLLLVLIKIDLARQVLSLLSFTHDVYKAIGEHCNTNQYAARDRADTSR